MGRIVIAILVVLVVVLVLLGRRGEDDGRTGTDESAPDTFQGTENVGLHILFSRQETCQSHSFIGPHQQGPNGCRSTTTRTRR
eukprot:scaffold685273_cov39-Attheya_sp.AAC.1